MSSLSKNVLAMKFMQRTKEKIEEKQDAADVFGISAEDAKEPARVTIFRTEESHVPCQQLVFGRMSFRGYNPEIEQLIAEKSGVKYQKRESSPEPADVSVQEMAESRIRNRNDILIEEPVRSVRSGQVKRKRSSE